MFVSSTFPFAALYFWVFEFVRPHSHHHHTHGYIAYFRYFRQNRFRGRSRVNMCQKRWRTNMNAGIHQKSICLTEPLCLHNIGPTTSWIMHCKLSHATRTSVWVIEYQLWPINDNNWLSHIMRIHTMVISLDVLRWIFKQSTIVNHHFYITSTLGNCFFMFFCSFFPSTGYKEMGFSDFHPPPVRWSALQKADFWAKKSACKKSAFQQLTAVGVLRQSDNIAEVEAILVQIQDVPAMILWMRWGKVSCW